MRTIATTIKAWLPSHTHIEYLNGTPDQAVSALAFNPLDMTVAGWTLVGEADIAVRFVDNDALIQVQVSALEKQRAAILADAQQKINYINDRISKLSALTYEPSEAV